MLEIVNIEKELERLFEEQKEKKLIKASLFNLIAYAHQPDRVATMRKTVHSIIEKFPCRIIFIEVKDDVPPDYLNVSVATSAMDGSQIACDQITLITSLANLRRVSYIITPHIVPDMPIYLLWGQDPTLEDELLPPLEKLAARLIFGSECSENLPQFAQRMLKKMHGSSLDFIDLNWAMIAGWRRVFATIFNTPEKLAILCASRTITLTYNTRKSPFTPRYDTQAIYFQGWLAAQLKWKFKSKEGKSVRYTNGVEVILEGKEYDTPPTGAILKVEVQSIDQYEASISREKEWSKAICHVCYKEICEMPYTLYMPDNEKEFQFIREIFLTNPSDHYRNMLHVVALMNGNKQ